MARQTLTGRVEVGDAVLECGRASEGSAEPAWLFASPETGRYVAAYHGLQPVRLTLAVPSGTVEIAEMGTGVVVWDNGEVAVESVGIRSEPTVTLSHK